MAYEEVDVQSFEITTRLQSHCAHSPSTLQKSRQLFFLLFQSSVSSHIPTRFLSLWTSAHCDIVAAPKASSLASLSQVYSSEELASRLFTLNFRLFTSSPSAFKDRDSNLLSTSRLRPRTSTQHTSSIDPDLQVVHHHPTIDLQSSTSLEVIRAPSHQTSSVPLLLM